MKRNDRRARLLIGATALAGGCLVTTASWAQSPSRAGARNPASQNQVEEVVVTAEKRAEGLQNVSNAITAVSGATLERASVREVGDLTQLAPSLQFGTRSTNVFIALRGIGQAGQDIGSQSGVTVSLDGVPLLNHFMMNPTFLDVERVEVLRGPQGTISGRNATGGAINVYSTAPTGRTEGGVSLTAGNYSRLGVKGYLNGPLSEDLSARLSFQREEAEGWLKNGFTGKRNDDTDITQVRGQLLYTPTAALSLRALVDYTHDRSDPSFAQIIRRADPARPTVTEVPGYAYPQNSLENLTVYRNEPNHRDAKDFRATLIARWDLSSDVSLTSTSGFIQHDIDLTDVDVDATPVASTRFDLIGLYAEQETQELTLTANLGDRADLVAGLFYMHGDSSEPLYLSLAAFKNYLVYLPEETLDSYAGYAQVRYNLTDKLRATLGGRYTTDVKSYEEKSSVAGTALFHADKGTFRAFTPRFVLDYTPTDESLIYASVSRGFKSGGFNTLGDVTLPVNRFDPEYVWNYEVGLKAMMFDRRLRMSLTGFYADYTNLQQTIFRLNEATQVRFPRVENSSSAKIKGVELEGEATPVTGLRLTGAVTYLDAQFGFFCNNNPLYPNVPTARSCAGVMRNGEALPPGAIQLEGNALTQAPHWQFNTSAQYAFPISSRLILTTRVDYKWQSRTYFDIYNNPQNSQSAYGLLNASVDVGTPDGAWSLTGWVRNAADKRYVSQGSAGSGATPAITGSLGMPRMYGLTLNHHF
ncbi:MAG: TonB-dependent receptor [Phenylobacterium sp.]|uniref:TonB-dependent receptor n=1 Tax=Phenylobacterium sp. TaxID=1871053 RepID=UPI0025E4A4E2|nr:TonB-dependent receptor [Phenylobacterium sp.]MBI1199280.1 TonB-dependent receptor [Phenylobacterium sp.]